MPRRNRKQELLASQASQLTRHFAVEVAFMPVAAMGTTGELSFVAGGVLVVATLRPNDISTIRRVADARREVASLNGATLPRCRE